MIQQTSNQNTQSWRKTFTSRVKSVLFFILGWIAVFFRLIFTYALRFIWEVHSMEQLFLNMNHIYGFLCQLLFLTMCEIAILGVPSKTSQPNSQHGLVGLSALLFYSVFGYFVAKVKEICQNDWSRSAQIRYSTSNYIKWFLKIVLEWAKAIAVVLCIRDKGITYQLDPKYSAVTFIYYVCTEKLFVELMIKFAGYMNIAKFDCMEHLYIPIILNTYVVLCAAAVSLYLLTGPQAIYAAFASYFVLYLRVKDLYFNFIKMLRLENQTYASFRIASESEIQKWDDICAVCLNRMHNALITPCNHLFHPACLKQCLRTSLQCPLCKHDFIE